MLVVRGLAGCHDRKWPAVMPQLEYRSPSSLYLLGDVHRLDALPPLDGGCETGQAKQQTDRYHSLHHSVLSSTCWPLSRARHIHSFGQYAKAL
jgi:hypothetical protein